MKRKSERDLSLQLLLHRHQILAVPRGDMWLASQMNLRQEEDYASFGQTSSAIFLTSFNLASISFHSTAFPSS